MPLSLRLLLLPLVSLRQMLQQPVQLVAKMGDKTARSESGGGVGAHLRLQQARRPLMHQLRLKAVAGGRAQLLWMRMGMTPRLTRTRQLMRTTLALPSKVLQLPLAVSAVAAAAASRQRLLLQHRSRRQKTVALQSENEPLQSMQQCCVAARTTCLTEPPRCGGSVLRRASPMALLPSSSVLHRKCCRSLQRPRPVSEGGKAAQAQQKEPRLRRGLRAVLVPLPLPLVQALRLPLHRLQALERAPSLLIPRPLQQHLRWAAVGRCRLRSRIPARQGHPGSQPRGGTRVLQGRRDCRLFSRQRRLAQSAGRHGDQAGRGGSGASASRTSRLATFTTIRTMTMTLQLQLAVMTQGRVARRPPPQTARMTKRLPGCVPPPAAAAAAGAASRMLLAQRAAGSVCSLQETTLLLLLRLLQVDSTAAPVLDSRSRCCRRGAASPIRTRLPRSLQASQCRQRLLLMTLTATAALLWMATMTRLM